MRGPRTGHDDDHHHGTAASSWLLSLCLLSNLGFVAAQDPDSENSVPPHEFVQRVVANELKAEQQDHSHWSFRLETRKPNGESEVDEVVETTDGDLKRPIQIDGRELTEEARHKADQRMQQLVHNPGPLQKARGDEDRDTARSQKMLKMLPDAFDFKYGQRRGDLVELRFSPNPSFHPPSHEAEVFHAMQGTLWVDAKQERVEEISGRLMHEVKFGGGVLGHLNQGGTFQVKQAAVAPGYWELTLLKVQMRGKALFFKTIGVQQDYSRSNFKQVPDDLTLAKAAEMLQKEPNLQSQAKAHR